MPIGSLSVLLVALCGVFGDALARQLNALVTDSVDDQKSFCDSVFVENFTQAFQQRFQRQPKVALFVAESLRFPARKNERMERWAQALNDADVFVAVPSESEHKVQFLPRAMRVGIFNHTFDWDSLQNMMTREGVDREGIRNAPWEQLRRTNDAFRLMEEQEQEQGWKYDVVARVRTESVQVDMCDRGPDQGCYAKGAWQRALAARTMSPGAEGTIFTAHDRAYWGRRDDMKDLFVAIDRYLGNRMHVEFIYNELNRSSDVVHYEVKTASRSIALNQVAGALAPERDRRQHEDAVWRLMDVPDEFTLREVIHQRNFTRVMIDGLDIRRFGCDYSESEGVTDRPQGHPADYAIGCKSFPRLSDASEHKCTQ